MDGTNAEEGAAAVVLPPVLNLAEVTDLIEKFQAVSDTDPLEVDASGVTQMSTPAVLLFVSALKSRESSNASVIVHNAPSSFADAFSELGLFPEVMKMEFRQ